MSKTHTQPVNTSQLSKHDQREIKRLENFKALHQKQLANSKTLSRETSDELTLSNGLDNLSEQSNHIEQ